MLRPLALSVAFLLLISSANAIVIRHDRDDAAYVRLGRHLDAVARVQNLGTGTLIAPRWVLTAAHVALVMAPAGSWVELGKKRYLVEAVIVHPEYAKDESSGHDIALLRLAEAVEGIEPVLPYRGSDEKGMTITFAGRGHSGNGNTGPSNQDGVLRAATNVVDRAEPLTLEFLFDAPPNGTELEGISGPGDSGGPALVERNGKLWTVGVSSGNTGRGDEHCRYGTTEIYARVSTRHAWIEKTMKDAPASNRTWFGPVWTDVLPDTPNAAPARAFLKAVRGDLASMRAFRLAWRTAQFLGSRPEAKHVEREEIWLRDFGKAKLEGYSADGDRRFAIFLSTPDEKWFSFAMDLENSKIAGVYVNEIMVPRPKTR